MDNLSTTQRIVLENIRTAGSISGADIARATGFQPSTITTVIRILKQEGMIEVHKIKPLRFGAGKPPTYWKLRGEYASFIGLEITQTEVRYCVINFKGEALLKEVESFEATMQGEEVVSMISSKVEKIISNKALNAGPFRGVGVAIPGLVDARTGHVGYSFSLDLNDFPLVGRLQNAVDLPVKVDNDANAGAQSVKWLRDTGQEIPEDIVFMIVSEVYGGIGAGLILNGKLFIGKSGTAGEFFNRLPGLSKMIEQAEKQTNHTNERLSDLCHRGMLSIDIIAAEASDGDVIAMQVLKKIIKGMGDEIARVTALLNPDVVVLGGAVSETKVPILDDIHSYVKKKVQRMFTSGIELPELELSRFGKFAAALGSVAHFFDQYFGPDA